MTVDEIGRGGDLCHVPIALATIVVLAVGVATGVAQVTTLAALAAAGFAASVALLSRDRLPYRALGSAGAIGSLSLLGAAFTTGDALVFVGALAVGATGAALVLEEGWPVALGRVLRHSAVSSVIVGVLVTVVAVVRVVPVGSIVGALVAHGTTDALDGLLSALVLGFLVVVTLVRALWVLSPVLPGGVELPTVPSIVDRLGSVQAWVTYVLLITSAVFSRGWLGPTFQTALGALGTPGALVEWLLTAGVLHIGLLAVGFAALAVLVGHALLEPLRVWLGPYPLRTLALSTGGIVLVLAVAIPTVTSSVEPTVRWASLAVIVVTFGVVEALASPVSTLLGVARCRRIALAVGAAAVFVATTLGAMAGVDALVVLGGVAATILVWDLGENALTVRDQLGRSVETRHVEFVHATASVVVGLVGVGVAVIGLTLAESAFLEVEAWQAAIAVALALGATFVFLVTAQGHIWLRGVRRWWRTAGTALRNPSAPMPVRTQVGAKTTLLLAAASFAGVVLVLLALGHSELVFWLVMTVFLVVALVALAGDEPAAIGRRWE